MFSGHSIGMQLFGPTSVLPRPARTASYQLCNIGEFDRPEFLIVLLVRVSAVRRTEPCDSYCLSVLPNSNFAHSALIAEINSLSP